MSSDSTQVNATPGKQRPEQVASLLYGGEIHPTWNFANKRASRFFVVNLEQVLGRINILVTKSEDYFEQATALITEKTGWNRQQPFEYICSKIQIYNDKIRLPKTFGRAATIIVAMELAATEQSAELNVYDYLRILAADQFVDRFDQARLQQLQAFHDGLSQAEKMERFGPLAQRPFEEIFLAHIEQTKSGFLNDLASGGCITRYTAEKIIQFVKAHYPDDLHVGPVLSTGQDAHCEGLGKGNTVEGLRVPRNIDLSELSTWS